MRYLSLCSGIEAATVAWKPLGWQAVAFAEIEPFPCAVLQHHWPDVPNLGDMTQISDWRPYRGAVDLVVGGTPCQDFSIAGKRAGLAGERSALALVFVQVLSVVAPQWFVWENVPGVFSTNGGRDFGTFLKALDDIGYSCAWRVLDAQYFGVPQRRRRVFVVGHLGDWRPSAAVLFEPQSLRRDTPPRRKTRQDIAGTLNASLGRSRGGGQDPGAIVTSHWEGGPHPALNQAHGKSGGIGMSNQELFSQHGGGLVPGYCPKIVNQAMSCKWSKGTSGPAGDEHHNLVAYSIRTAQTSSNGWGISEEKSHTLDQANGMAICAPLTTRPYADNASSESRLLISFHGSQDPNVSGDTSHCLGRNNGLECCVAVQQNQCGEVRVSSVMGTLNTNSNASGRNAPLIFQQNERDEVRTMPYAGVLQAQSGMKQQNYLYQNMRVRRLTPTEAERLQGFPDGHTAIMYNGKPAADGQRYKALGNSMAVPVMRWIGERIQIVSGKIH